MVSEDKITSFLKLQQIVSDIEDSTRLLEQFLPIALQELNLVGYPYVFLSTIFIDGDGKIKQTFFTDKSEKPTTGEVTKGENIFQKGSEWEMKVMYGEAAVISDVTYFINSTYPDFPKIHSLLILPIQHAREFRGVLVLANAKSADQINTEEIEFGQMVTRLIDLSFRLQDTESSLIQITKQVYEANNKLHQLDKLKDDFVSIASHELRTPMTAIKSYVWMAINRSDMPLTDKLRRYLSRTLISTDRLINLVNDMLNVSRIESGRISISPRPFDIYQLVSEVLTEVAPKAGEKGIHLTLDPNHPPQVFADPDKTHQVLLNLIGNSMKFTPTNGIITVYFLPEGEMVDVCVKDTGVGITREDLEKLFKKFGRLDNSYVATATSGGTGLGLYISKSLVELMHGKIRAASEGLNKGTTFIFSLPLVTQKVLAQADKYMITPPSGEAKTLEPVAI